jgi:hypothetical protein
MTSVSSEQTRAAVVKQPGDLIQVMATHGSGEEWCAIFRVMQPIDLDQDAAQFRSTYNYPEPGTTLDYELLWSLHDWRDEWIKDLAGRGILSEVETTQITYYQCEGRTAETWDLSIKHPSEPTGA